MCHSWFNRFRKEPLKIRIIYGFTFSPAQREVRPLHGLQQFSKVQVHQQCDPERHQETGFQALKPVSSTEQTID